MNALSPMPEAPATRTTCPYCGVGCGVIATPDGMGGAAIAGDPEHPANFGRLCSKGSALGETLGLGTRLLHPMLLDAAGTMRAHHGTPRSTTSPKGFAAYRAKHGPDGVAFYLSGQLLTEDYYVANKLMKGFIGSANVDTNSRLCMASSVAGHRRAFGSDTVPGCYEDLDQADLLVLVGSNAAWCHPVLFQRMQARAAKRAARSWSSSIRAAPRRAKRPTCTSPSGPARTRRCSAACWSIWPTPARSIRTSSATTRRVFGEALDRARAIAPDARGGRRRDGTRRRRHRAFLRAVAPVRSASSPATRRA